MVSFPYYSHIFGDSKMGVGLGSLVWVPLTIFGGPMSDRGSLKIPLDQILHEKMGRIQFMIKVEPAETTKRRDTRDTGVFFHQIHQYYWIKK